MLVSVLNLLFLSLQIMLRKFLVRTLKIISFFGVFHTLFIIIIIQKLIVQCFPKEYEILLVEIVGNSNQ